MAHPNLLKDARVLVFGGTSGIGFAVASLALSHNAYVIISGSTQTKTDAKVKELQEVYPSLPADHVKGYAVDLSDRPNLEKNLETLFETVTEGGTKKIDHVAFTAGSILELPHITEVTVESAVSGFGVRFMGPIIIGKIIASGKYMPKSANSSFTITGGVNFQKPLPGWAVASSWGGAATGLMRGLAVDLTPIRVNCVEPGAIQTPLLDHFMVEGPTGEAFKKKLRDDTLLGRIGEAYETAEAYGWFMKDRFATGTIAETNGGCLLARPGY